MRAIVEGVEERLLPTSWPVYTGSNHDAGPARDALGRRRPGRARLAVLMLLTLRGTPFLYYGDEIGLADVPIDPEQALDPVARRTGDPDRNRDPCRTPMQWTAEAGAGFTEAGVTPWLPFGDPAACNVADQRDDPDSQLHLVRDLIALRRAHAELHSGTYATLPAPEGAWAFRRGDAFAVALNLTDGECTIEDVTGTLVIATDRARDGEPVDGALRLGPWHGAVVQLRG